MEKSGNVFLYHFTIDYSELLFISLSIYIKRIMRFIWLHHLYFEKQRIPFNQFFLLFEKKMQGFLILQSLFMITGSIGQAILL